MKYYLEKYLGKYRLMAEIDLKTNDFCRDKNGTYCNDNDIFIKCAKGTRIWHVGKDILQVYIPSVMRGNNLIKKIDSKYIFDIEQTDKEVLFKLHDKDLEEVIKHLEPTTVGARISPFSPKNLKSLKQPKTMVIESEKNAVYEEISHYIPKEDKLVILQWNRSFIEDFLTKKTNKTKEEIKADIKKQNMKQKDYFCFVGYWDEYIEFLKRKVIENYASVL